MGILVHTYRAPTYQLYQRFAQEQAAGEESPAMPLDQRYYLVQDAIDKGYIASCTPRDDSTVSLFRQDQSLV